MSLSQRLQRIEGQFTRNRRQHETASEADAKALWSAGLELLSLDELNRLEPIVEKITRDAERRGLPERCWMHELLDEPCLTTGEKDELISIFATMGLDLVGMAEAAAGEAP